MRLKHGWYTPKVKGSSSCNFKTAVYHIAGGKSTYLGDYTFASAAEEKSLNAVKLVAGKNILVFGVREGSDGQDLKFEKISFDMLENQSAPTPSDVALDVPAKIVEGRDYSLSASLKMSDDTFYGFADYEINTANGTKGTATTADRLVITSSDTSIFTVTDVAKGGAGATDTYTFSVNGVSEGRANLVFTPYFGGVAGTPIEKEIEIKGLPVAPYDIDIDFSELSKNSSVNITGADIQWPARYNAEPSGVYGIPTTAWVAYYANGALGGGVNAQWETEPNGANRYHRLALNVNVTVDEEGWYAPELTAISNGDFKASIYHIAGGKATYLGDYHFKESAAAKTLNAIYLTEGANMIVFGTREGKDGQQIKLQRLKFKKINSTVAPTISDVDIIAPAKITEGAKYSVSASLKMSNGASYSFADYAINATTGAKGAATNADRIEIASSDNGIFTVADLKKGGAGYTDEYTFTVKGVSVGTANVIITPYIGNVAQTPITKEITIEAAPVAPYDIELDFANLKSNATYLEAMQLPERYTIDMVKATPNVRTNHQGILFSFINPTWTENSGSLYNKMAITFNVGENEEGWYSPVFVGGLNSNNFKASIYHYSVESKVATFLGDYDFSAPEGQVVDNLSCIPGAQKVLNSVHLAPGEHQIWFCVRGGAEGGKNLFVRNLTFKALPRAVAIDGIEAEFTTIAEGEHKSFDVALALSDGNTFNFAEVAAGVSDPHIAANIGYDENNYIKVTSADERIVVARRGTGAGLCNDERFKFTLVGVGKGETKITLTPVINGEEQTEFAREYDITVTASETITVDFSTLTPNTKQSNLKFPAHYAPNTTLGVSGWETSASGTIKGAVSTKWDERDEESKLAIDVFVEEGKNGWYVPVITEALTNENVKGSVFAGSTYVGDFDFSADAGVKINAGEAENGKDVTLNAVYLNEGKNTLTFAVREGASDEVSLHVRKIVLRKLTEAPTTADISSDIPSYFTQFASRDLTASLEMSDTSLYNFTEYKVGDDVLPVSDYAADTENRIEITSSDEGIFTVTDVEKAGFGKASQYNYTVNPIGQGSAEVIFTPYIGGVAQTPIRKAIIVDEPARLGTVTLTPEKASFGVDRDTNVTISLKDIFGEDYTGEYTTEFESLDTRIATVTKIDEGEVKIRATVTPTSPLDAEEVAKSGETAITVVERPHLKSISLSSGRNALAVGESTEYTIDMLMTDNLPEFDAGEYTLVWENDNPSVISIDEENGKLIATGIGDTGIWVSIINEKGKKIRSEVLEMQVGDAIESDMLAGVIIDFGETTTGKVDGKGWWFTSTPGYTVVESESGTSWTTKSGTDGLKRLLINIGTSDPEKVWPHYAGPSNMVTIKVNIPKNDYYAVNFCGGKLENGPGFAIYLDGTTYLGDYDFFGVGTDNAHRMGETKRLNTVYLTAGEHKISFRCTKALSEKKTCYISLGKLQFLPLGLNTAPVPKTIETNLSEVILGEATTLEARLKMSDGSYYHFGKRGNGAVGAVSGTDEENVMTITSENSKLEVPEENVIYINDGNSGVVKYTVIASESGEDNLIFSGKAGGNTFSFAVPVRVTDDTLASTELTVEKDVVFVGDTVNLKVKNLLESGKELSSGSGSVVITSSNEEVATVSGNVLTAISHGTTTIKVTTTFGSVTLEDSVQITVFSGDIKTITATAGGSRYIRLTDDPNDTVPMYIEATMADGKVFDLTGGPFEYEALTPQYADIDENGTIYPKAEGVASFTIISRTEEGEKRFDASLTVVKGKDGFILFTQEMRDAAVENAKTYDWAKDKQSAAVKTAKNDAENLDLYYNAIISEGIPRSIYVGAANDAGKWNCRYCGADLAAANGATEYYAVNVKTPWKIRCTECARSFPSNDFASFYQLGLNEYGEFDRMRALEAHRAMLIEKGLMSEAAINMTSPGKDIALREEVSDMDDWYDYYGYGVEGGYLHNDLYPEIGNASCPVELYEGERPEVWGADDGWGYRSGRSFYNASGVWECDEVMTFIGFYANSMNNKTFNAMKNSYNAYLYTGDPQYGRFAAIILDRFADFYPYYDLAPYKYFIDAGHGGTGEGNIWGCITESINGPFWGEAYDAVFDLYEDEFVLNYIAEKNAKFKMRHAKETPSQIRTNVEDGLLRAVMDGTQDLSVRGNYGFIQATVASCATALDTNPDTEKWLDWLITPGFSGAVAPTGGSLYDYIIDRVDHDGMGDEGSQYNYNWVTYLADVQKYLDRYVDKYGSENVETNLYNNPKFVSMLYSFVMATMSNYFPNMGDSQRCALNHYGLMGWDYAIQAYRKTGNELFLRYIYNRHFGVVDRYNEGMFVKNPEAIQQEILDAVEKNGDFNLPSYMMTGFGLGALRGGAIHGGYAGGYDFGKPQEDNRRGIWMYFGTSLGHGHQDSLNIGIDAFGHNLAPDLGYPPKADRDPQGQQWISASLSHNTVTIRQDTGDEYWDNNRASQRESAVRGKSLHFDDSDKVKVMDVEAPDVFAAAELYRRSLIMVEVDDDNAYTVDFFRVKGGDTHEFSFHAQAKDAYAAGGLGEVTPQVDASGNYIGTYASPDVPLGSDPFYEFTNSYPMKYPRGYTWLDHVDRYNNPTEKIEVDFKIEDFLKINANPSGIRLRATMLGLDTENTKVTIANGYPALVAANDMIPHFKYLLVKRDGKDLDTLFTTVYEPYRNTRIISSIDEMPLTVKSGYENELDEARAVRVTLANGRVDYVFYATNNEVTYTLADGDATIDFRGFAGVYSLYKGENTYKYVCDGDIIGEAVDGDAAVTGRITDFTKELAFENYITIKPDKEVSDEVLEDLVGRYMFIENDGKLNSSYMIEEVERLENGDLYINVGSRIEKDGRELMDVGSPTLIRTLKNPNNLDGGYIYNLSKRDDVVIPLSYADDNAPVFTPVSDGTVSAGSMYQQTVHAEGHNGAAVTIIGRELPRGASFDATTNTFMWKPTKTQVGINHVSLTARDEFGRETTIHFNIEVFGSTTSGSSSGSKPKDPVDSGASSGDSSSSGSTSGGGGGGGADVPPAVDPDEPIVEPEDPTDEPDAPSANGFTDLGEHAWATDAINALAEAGIIKGTSESTFAPANNITRADYAILLVRAFKLESENAENFADVSDTDYFARELAVARNTGIVGGIGDNKYAPKNTITRQDMMVILHRALTKMGVEGLVDPELVDEVALSKTYTDYSLVSDYAKEAVSVLSHMHLVNGKSGRIAPTEPTTRTEVAVLLKRVLDYIETNAK